MKHVIFLSVAFATQLLSGCTTARECPQGILPTQAEVDHVIALARDQYVFEQLKEEPSDKRTWKETYEAYLKSAEKYPNKEMELFVVDVAVTGNLIVVAIGETWAEYETNESGERVLLGKERYDYFLYFRKFRGGWRYERIRNPSGVAAYKEYLRKRTKSKKP